MRAFKTGRSLVPHQSCSAFVMNEGLPHIIFVSCPNLLIDVVPRLSHARGGRMHMPELVKKTPLLDL